MGAGDLPKRLRMAPRSTRFFVIPEHTIVIHRCPLHCDDNIIVSPSQVISA